MSRVGVFVCHCGHNIAGILDVPELVRVASLHAEVAFAADYRYMCSDPGQDLIRSAIAEHHLDAVVVAACSPAMHESTFRKACAAAGVNAFRCESANIREQVSWVHQSRPQAATVKAADIIGSVVEKVRRNSSLEPIRLPLSRRCLVIGGGISGLHAALDLADAGYPVVLVERQPSLGGKMRQFSRSYLNLSDGEHLLQERLQRVEAHPQIQVLTRAQVREVAGYVGNFKARVVRQEADGEVDFAFEVGAIVVATGWDSYPLGKLADLGGGVLPDVVDTLTFERMLLQPEGPRRPSDGRVPQQVVFIQCAGSRNAEGGVPYCSKVCCMVVAKQARAYRERVPQGRACVFYTDIRSGGKGYEEYVQQAAEEFGVLYLRGQVRRVYEADGKVKLLGEDTLTGLSLELTPDLVVLATPLVPSEGAQALAQVLHISADAAGFLSEAHPKLRPVETLTAGVFLAGCCQGPKDIPESVAQAGAAAAKVMQLFSQEMLSQSPTVAIVDGELCAGCGACIEACPYGARSLSAVRPIAVVNPALCQACGACAVVCPNKATEVVNWVAGQILAMVGEVS
ncbi:MAG: CoB--CoM heterodisulfide reductase iron-sulfur subunit A family protein [Anaerolineales bacterium]|nr:CoB--CoM heterodisulfide reductase iron-sulfur subunit A family protein [Anaerolineales bacterium]